MKVLKIKKEILKVSLKFEKFLEKTIGQNNVKYLHDLYIKKTTHINIIFWVRIFNIGTEKYLETISGNQ